MNADDKVAALLNDREQKLAEHYQNCITSTQRRITDLHKKLNTLKEEYVRTGVAHITQSFVSDWEYYFKESPTVYFRELAKELDRPVLIAEWIYTFRHGGRTVLSIPRNPRMNNAASFLQMISSANRAELICDVRPRTWKFIFVGDTGLRHLEAFKSYCVENAVMRVVLKLSQRG